MRSLSLVFVAACAAACNPADKILLWPPSGPTEPNGAVRRVVDDGVEVWTVPRDAPDAYVLRFYGNGARAEWSVAEEAAALPHVVFWGVNYHGYGGSSGDATLDGVARAAISAYDTLAREAKGKPIFAFGTSMGSVAALHLGAERDVKGLLLWNPPPLKRLVLEEHGWWNLFLVAAPTALSIPASVDSEANARRCHMPAVFVMSDRDGVVPIQYQGRVIAAYAGQKDVIVLPGAGHNDSPAAREAEQIAVAVQRMMDHRNEPVVPEGKEGGAFVSKRSAMP